jgi:hydrogenase nickel incorporation protein HypB
MVSRHLSGWEISDYDFLFVENVGNLVCTSSYDLGESLRVALLSVTEGEDKPLKYPTLFHSADAVVISKIDLAEVCEFDLAQAERNVRSVRPDVPFFRLSAKTGEGLTEWIAFLESHLAKG